MDYGPEAIVDWDGYVCRWFDCHLKGIDNQVLSDPPVHVFVMGRNAWRSASDWPLPEAVPTKYYLHSSGHANSSAGDGTLSTSPPDTETPDRYAYDPNDPTPSPPFANGHMDGPRDVSQAAARPDVLVYATPVLERGRRSDRSHLGPTVRSATSPATPTGWSGWSTCIPDGRAMFLAEGVMRARHRDDRRNGAFCPDRSAPSNPHASIRTRSISGGRPGTCLPRGIASAWRFPAATIRTTCET